MVRDKKIGDKQGAPKKRGRGHAKTQKGAKSMGYRCANLSGGRRLHQSTERGDHELPGKNRKVSR